MIRICNLSTYLSDWLTDWLTDSDVTYCLTEPPIGMDDNMISSAVCY